MTASRGAGAGRGMAQESCIPCSPMDATAHITSFNEFFAKGRYSALEIGRATAPVSRAHKDSSLGGHTYTLTYTYTNTYMHS